MCPVSVNIHLNSTPLPLPLFKQFDYWIETFRLARPKFLILQSICTCIILFKQFRHHYHIPFLLLSLIRLRWWCLLSSASFHAILSTCCSDKHFLSPWWVIRTRGIAFSCVMSFKSAAVTLDTTHVPLRLWFYLLRLCIMHWRLGDFCPAVGRLEDWIRKCRGLCGFYCFWIPH